MEERNNFGQEIVETYRRADPREVVEVYTRPMAGAEEPKAPPPTRRRSHRRGLWVFLICLTATGVLAIVSNLLGQGAGSGDPFEQYYEESQGDSLPQEISIPTSPTGQGMKVSVTRERGVRLSPQEIYRRVNPSVVTVLVELEEGMSVGTGVIFAQNGYILTNHHVVAGGRDCVVVLENGYSHPARYVAGDAANDLAVLKVELDNLPAAVFGDSDLLTVGDPVYAIGHPLGVELRGTLTDGLVSAINRDIWVDDHTMTLIQTNAALNSGNSGGPLINEYGQVVGINVIKMTSHSSNVEGLGFAIPTASMERIVNDLLTWGKLQPEPVLGITVITLAEQAADGVWGLRVESVTPGGAGDQAGLQAGDILLSADGEPLTGSQDLLRVRRRHYVGDTIQLVVWRDGRAMEMTLHLQDALEDEEEVPPWYAQEKK